MASSVPTADSSVHYTTQHQIKSIISGSIGNLVEWYDWYVYSAFALYFAPAFFPKGNQTAQLLNSAAIFAVGFLMRPLGGWLLGLYADRKGRKAALLLSVLLMCGGSLLIALLPSYSQIGVLAPTLLVIARLLQGLSVGGEYGTSATYLSEMAGQQHRGFQFSICNTDCWAAFSLTSSVRVATSTYSRSAAYLGMACALRNWSCCCHCGTVPAAAYA
jgi:MHS family alpha-ketoglutarate permease-like MFS transporter